MQKNKQRRFIKTVWQHYDDFGRHDLAWRQMAHLKPYNILVSELMLQQTQVARVIPKYRAFIKQWGSTTALAKASLGDVLRAWQGLGYNRRAKLLQQCCQMIQTEYGGRFPRTYDSLLSLPGVGPYTAAAVMNFAYNIPIPLIETNVRTVYLHHFFADETDIPDTELMPIIEATLDQDRPREWFWALMDYGSYLKQTIGNQNARSKHYAKQSKFAGSDRQIRGAIMRVLMSQSTLTRAQVITKLSVFEDIRVDAQLAALVKEGLVSQERDTYQLPR